jgi:hypothetical protein
MRREFPAADISLQGPSGESEQASEDHLQTPSNAPLDTSPLLDLPPVFFGGDQDIVNWADPSDGGTDLAFHHPVRDVHANKKYQNKSKESILQLRRTIPTDTKGKIEASRHHIEFKQFGLKSTKVPLQCLSTRTASYPEWLSAIP